jgi:hypothetical protein
VVSFTLRPLYSQGKSPWYPLDRRLGGPQSRSGRGEEKNSQPRRTQYFVINYYCYHHHRRRRRLSRIRPHGLLLFRIYFSETYEFILTFGRTPWTGDRPDARPLPTQDNTTHKNADTHPCLEWDSNTRYRCSSGRRQYLP